MVVRQQFGHRPSGFIGNLGIVRVVVLAATWTFQFWSSFEWSFDNNLGIVRAVVSTIIWSSSKVVVSATNRVSFEWLFRQSTWTLLEWLFWQEFGHRSTEDYQCKSFKRQNTVMRGARLCLRAMLSIRTSDSVLILEKRIDKI